MVSDDHCYFQNSRIWHIYLSIRHNFSNINCLLCWIHYNFDRMNKLKKFKIDEQFRNSILCKCEDSFQISSMSLWSSKIYSCLRKKLYYKRAHTCLKQRIRAPAEIVITSNTANELVISRVTCNDSKQNYRRKKRWKVFEDSNNSSV